LLGQPSPAAADPTGSQSFCFQKRVVKDAELFALDDSGRVAEEPDALRTRHPEFRIDYVASPNWIDEKSIPQLVPDIQKPMPYVSGPKPMVESMDETLKKIGIPEERIKNDFFPGYEWP
jgi:ferredoxin-NADP reductase